MKAGCFRLPELCAYYYLDRICSNRDTAAKYAKLPSWLNPLRGTLI